MIWPLANSDASPPPPTRPLPYPSLDTAGQDLVYDQQDPAGHRAILADRPWSMAAPEPLSLDQDASGSPLDNHHPAISGDGRYLAYLETATGTAGPPARCMSMTARAAVTSANPVPPNSLPRPRMLAPTSVPMAVGWIGISPARPSPSVSLNPLLAEPVGRAP